MKMLLKNTVLFLRLVIIHVFKYRSMPLSLIYDFLHFLKQYFSYYFLSAFEILKIRNRHYYSEKGEVAENEIARLTSGLYFKDFCYVRPNTSSLREIADLLIIFDDTIIIFSVKNVKMKFEEEYPPFPEINIPQKALEKSIKQLDGAERFLRQQEKLVLCDMGGTRSTINFSKIKKFYKVSVNCSIIEPARFFSGFSCAQDTLILSKKDFDFMLKYVSTISELISLLEFRSNPPRIQRDRFDTLLLLRTARDYISLWLEDVLYKIYEDENNSGVFIGDFNNYEEKFLSRNKRQIEAINKKSNLFDNNIKTLIDVGAIKKNELVKISKLKRIDRFYIIDFIEESQENINSVKKHRTIELNFNEEDIRVFILMCKNIQEERGEFKEVGIHLSKKYGKEIIGILIDLKKNIYDFETIEVFYNRT